MIAISLAIGFVISMGQDAPHVTREQKTEFLHKLEQWPHREFFTAKAVEEVIPYVPVLFALTDQDIKNYIIDKTGKPLEKVEREYGIYPFLALSADLVENAEVRAYAVKHFRDIAHPEIKLAWAGMIFDRHTPSPEIVRYLRSALSSKEQREVLKSMVGPNFEKFQKKLNDYSLDDQ